MGTATCGTVRRLDMTAIADAIRAKGGASGSLAPSEMASAIANIPAGGIYADRLIDRTITVASDDEFETIRIAAFYGCTSLASVSFPACTMIGDSAFRSCTSLTVASFPVCSRIGGSAFYGCTSLTVASFPACTSIGSSAFRSCTSLVSLFFRASNMSSIASTVFNRTNSTFRICVPTSLVTYYQQLAGWSSLASQIEAFDDWEF